MNFLKGFGERPASQLQDFLSLKKSVPEKSSCLEKLSI